MKKRRIGASCVAGVALLLTTAASAQVDGCPVNRIWVSDWIQEQELLTSDPVNELSVIFAAACSQARGSYDLLQGRFEANAGGVCPASATVTCVDEYWLLNVPPDTELAFSVQLRINGRGWTRFPEFPGPVGSYGASIEDVVSGLDTTLYSSQNEEHLIALPIVMRGGDVRPIEFRVSASEGGDGGAHVTAQIEFVGLPHGVGIRSCQGFGFDVPVQVEQLSWGRLKAVYR